MHDDSRHFHHRSEGRAARPELLHFVYGKNGNFVYLFRWSHVRVFRYCWILVHRQACDHGLGLHLRTVFARRVHTEPLPRWNCVHSQRVLSTGGHKLRAKALKTNRSTLWRTFRFGVRRSPGENGSAMVEMALVCAFVYLPMLFGIFQVAYGLYIYNFVCSAAHQATRYAAVRGSNSCIVQSNFVNCNLNPTGSTNTPSGAGTPLQNYVDTLSLMGIDQSKLSVAPTWFSRSNDNSSGFSNGSWNTPCATAGCNAIGNAVQVTVTYNFPLGIPGGRTLAITGVSKMMISE